MNFPESITIYNRTGLDGYGKPTYNSGTSYSCRILETYDRLITDKEETFLKTFIVYFDGDISVSQGDRAKIDSDYYRVMSVDKFKDYNGTVRITRIKLRNE